MLTARIQYITLGTVFAVCSGYALAGESDNRLEKFISDNGFVHQIVMDDAALAEHRGRSIHLPPTDLPVILWDELDTNPNKLNTKNAPDSGMYNITVSVDRP